MIRIFIVIRNNFSKRVQFCLKSFFILRLIPGFPNGHTVGPTVEKSDTPSFTRPDLHWRLQWRSLRTMVMRMTFTSRQVHNNGSQPWWFSMTVWVNVSLLPIIQCIFTEIFQILSLEWVKFGSRLDYSINFSQQSKIKRFWFIRFFEEKLDKNNYSR